MRERFPAALVSTSRSVLMTGVAVLHQKTSLSVWLSLCLAKTRGRQRLCRFNCRLEWNSIPLSQFAYSPTIQTPSKLLHLYLVPYTSFIFPLLSLFSLQFDFIWILCRVVFPSPSDSNPSSAFHGERLDALENQLVIRKPGDLEASSCSVPRIPK